jgi:DNA polymerase III epsilon subunit-like protein
MNLPNMNNNIPCAVDVETTGALAGYHEIIQIACLPLNQHFEEHEELRFFYINIKPDYPKRASKEAERKHKLKLEDLSGCVTQRQGVKLFEEWFDKLNLGMGKRLIPLAHNWGFERGHLINWMGLGAFDDIWQSHPRDTMVFGAMINDLYQWHGRKHPFPYLGLKDMCRRFDINIENHHDALSDCIATARLYAALMRFLHS